MLLAGALRAVGCSCVGRLTRFIKEKIRVLTKASGCMLNHPFPTDSNFLLSKVAVPEEALRWLALGLG